MKQEELIDDIWINVIEFLPKKDQIQFVSTSKHNREKLKKFVFNEIHVTDGCICEYEHLSCCMSYRFQDYVYNNKDLIKTIYFENCCKAEFRDNLCKLINPKRIYFINCTFFRREKL